MLVRPDGPIPARVMIVGEAPGAEEERLGRPFVGASGYELDRMLNEAGISRSECFVTNVCRTRPPGNDITKFFAKAKKDRTPSHTEVKGKWATKEILDGLALLQHEIQVVQPKIIVALGNTALWGLCGLWGITKWRGSMLRNADGIKVIPTIHPAAILREWKQRAIAVNDLRRAARFKSGIDYPKPTYKFTLRPTYEETIRILGQLEVRAHHAEPLTLSFDLETRSGHIACAGLAWSRTEALCIPFMCVERKSGFWTEEEEAQILLKLYRILTHPNVQVIGQNLLYDCQYTWKHWHFIPRVTFDTMIGQHAMFSSMPKALAFIASLYCEYYVFWKGEGKDFYANV